MTRRIPGGRRGVASSGERMTDDLVPRASEAINLLRDPIAIYRRTLIERAAGGDEWVSGHDLAVRIGYLLPEDHQT